MPHLPSNLAPLLDSRHPSIEASSVEWHKWREAYRGGEEFRFNYLEKFDTREDVTDFKFRRSITPIPSYAKSALNNVRNSIFQRLGDVVRKGGSTGYQRAMEGEEGGVDRRGASMNFFLGDQVLTELLVMGKVGIFVDMPEVRGDTLLEEQNIRPYLYLYQREDILNWVEAEQGQPSEFQRIVLRDTFTSYNEFGLPELNVSRVRYLWINEETGKVNLFFVDPKGNMTDKFGNIITEPIELELTRIPFVLLDIGDSLMKDIADDQIALLNLGSSDVNYILKANFPFYTEQRDPRAVGAHLKDAATDGSATTGGQGATDKVIKVGATHGRTYPIGTERPAFISPPTEPLEVSIKKQEQLEHAIRKKVNLAVQNMGIRASAESKSMDNQGLEAGLGWIGLNLQGAENRIAELWAAYEDKRPARRKIAKVKYPERWSLKEDKDRIEESDKLSDLAEKFPSRTARKEIAKTSVSVLLGGKIKADTMETIFKEIEDSDFTSGAPEWIIKAKDAGLVSVETAAKALGFNPEEAEKATQDHIDRLKRIQAAQTPEVRGVSDTSGDPSGSAKEEKELSRNRDTRSTTTPRVRGEND